MDEYDMYDENLKNQPFMKIIVSVVGRHFDKPILPIVELSAGNLIYEIDDTDPRLFDVNFTELDVSNNWIIII